MDTAVDIDVDGTSISAQREFSLRRAGTVQAVVDREFIEPGQLRADHREAASVPGSAALRREHSEIDYVIIYMRSPAFGNFGDAVLTGTEVRAQRNQEAGCIRQI